MVGLVGLTVFLVTGSLIVTGWKDLTDQHDFSATVTTVHKSLGFKSNTVDNRQTKVETYEVRYANVYRIAELHVGWDESTGPAQGLHTVTVVLLDPAGQEVARASGVGGKQGLTLRKELYEPPESQRFTGRQDGSAQFEALYPRHGESIGAWRVAISSRESTGSSPTIAYSVTFVIDYYTVTYQRVDELEAAK